MSLQIGDSIIVNDGVKESEEFELVLGGWQGRIIKVVDEEENEDPLFEVEWDSLTLQQLPDVFIRDSYRERVPWQTMNLRQSNLTKIEPRDEVGDVGEVQIEIEKKFFLGLMGDAGLRIAKILTGIPFFNSDEAAQRWLNYLRSNVRLPLPVIVEHTVDESEIKPGAIARITSFDDADDDLGVWVTIVYNTRKIDYPLFNLKTLSADSPYAQLLEDYKEWFDELDF